LKPKQKRKSEVLNEKLSLYINKIQNALPNSFLLNKKSVRNSTISQKTQEKSPSEKLNESSSSDYFENINNEIRIFTYINK